MQTAILIVSWNPRHLLVIHITKTARVSFVGNCSISKLIALNKLWTGCQDPSMFFLMHACIHEFIKKKKKEKTNNEKNHTHPYPKSYKYKKFLVRAQLCYTHVLDLNTLSLRIIENTLLSSTGAGSQYNS